ncbi:MAG: discoidin domain-containing protein [Pirellulales bacterium]|nr:discoidin domain-containing protein [Pirellulales bacterium]
MNTIIPRRIGVGGVFLETFAILFQALLVSVSMGAAEAPKNLALRAKATASESQGDLTPGKANDGKMETRWSGIPGHNSGVWYELDWDEPVEVAEVVLRQYDNFVTECDVQVRVKPTDAWQTVRHLGKPEEHLPRTVAIRFAPRQISGLRIGNIMNGPSFDEVVVYRQAFSEGIVTRMASDLRGNFVGIVTDAEGSSPVADAEVTLAGAGKAGDWKASARSDEKGMFSIPMPVGLNGQIQVRTEAGAESVNVPPVESQVDAAEFAFRLTPRDARRNPTNLNGKWKFSLDPPKDFYRADFDDQGWSDIAVPAHWEMEGFHNASYVGGYRRHFQAPGGAGRWKLCFEGVYSGAEVWVNGTRVATHEGGFTPFEVDVTDAIRKGDNLLAVRVTQHTTTSEQLDRMSVYADFPLAGIIRPVYLFSTPAAHVGSLEIDSQFDKDYRQATMNIRTCVVNESTEPFRGTLDFRLHERPLGAGEKAATGDEVAKQESSMLELKPWESKEVEVSLPILEPKPWTAERPNLYALSVGLMSGGTALEHFDTRVGIRQTEIRGTEILVNGKPVKFRGTCHHDSHPMMGRAVTPSLIRKDLELMKKANLNAVRTSHYPPLSELPAIADELGLYVEDEASFCWVGASDDLRNTPRIIQLTAELLARDRNHPSVASWSICNESSFGYGFARSHEWVRATDPTRPTSAATSTTLEIATLHNPITLARMHQQETSSDKPLLFDESLAVFQGEFNDVGEMWLDPGIRDYYAVPLIEIYDCLMKSKVTQGTYIWCWSDDLFCVPNRGIEFGRGATRSFFVVNSYRIPGRGIVGESPWGVIDGWRREKPEFWITKKLHSPVRIKEGPLPMPEPGQPIRVPVENQYDFSNLSELKIQWSIGNEQGVLRADVAPRSTGELVIQPARRVEEGAVLSLEFKDRDDRLVDAFRLPLGREPLHAAPGEKFAAGDLELRYEDYLSGSSTIAAGNGFHVAIDTENGRLRRGVANGEALLLELPLLHVLRTARPFQPVPDRISWHVEKIDVKKVGPNVVATVAGKYDDFHGGYEITFTPAGKITVSSSFKYTGKDFLAREVGLRFSVPTDCNVLNWERHAEWSVYPKDHIGRPSGMARAFEPGATFAQTAGLPIKVEPTQTESPASAVNRADGSSGRVAGGPLPAAYAGPANAWSADVSPMGTNDFRSTKRNIHWAAIHYPEGPGVVVESNGKQHVRAMVENDRISVHVNDWYGGTNVGLTEWTINYGQGKAIHQGDTIDGTVTLQLTPRFGRVD